MLGLGVWWCKDRGERHVLENNVGSQNTDDPNEEGTHTNPVGCVACRILWGDDSVAVAGVKGLYTSPAGGRTPDTLRVDSQPDLRKTRKFVRTTGEPPPLVPGSSGDTPKN